MEQVCRSASGIFLHVASLARLPAEVLAVILEQLSPAALRMLCLTSRSLRAQTEPFLYSTIKLVWLQARPPLITSLLRSILRRPQLAAYIEHLALDGTCFHSPIYHSEIPKLSVSEHDLSEPVSFVESLANVQYHPLWLQELRLGTMDAFVAVLLSRLSNLRVLRLGPDFARETELVGLVINSAVCHPESWLSAFPRLEHVSLCHRDFSGPPKRRNTADALALFYLPSARHISALIHNPAKFAWPAAAEPTPLNLESLAIAHIREQNLGHILSTTRNLTRLSWEWVYNDITLDEPIGIIDLDQISVALSLIQDTLEDLVITAEFDRDVVDPPIDSKGALSWIAGFSNLRKLEVPLVFLVGWPFDTTKRLQGVLPRNIEYLIITDDMVFHDDFAWHDDEIYGLFASFMMRWETFTPRLRQLTLLLKTADEGYGQAWRTRLELLCSSAGAPFRVVKLEKDL